MPFRSDLKTAIDEAFDVCLQARDNDTVRSRYACLIGALEHLVDRLVRTEDDITVCIGVLRDFTGGYPPVEETVE